MRLEVITNPEICQECGGNCCQHMPGIAFPEDFGKSRMQMLFYMVEALSTGFWAIDWWDGDPRWNGDDRFESDLDQAYFIRPATVHAKGRLYDPSWGGVCVLWSQKYGCSLKPEKRPRQCRMLKPVPLEMRERNDGCKTAEENDKRSAAIAWIQYHDLIETAAWAAGIINESLDA